MNGPDFLTSALRTERDAFTQLAPAPEFPALWHEVEARREARLQRLLLLAAVVPTLILFSAGIFSFLLGGGLMAGVPLLALAFWLALNDAGASVTASAPPLKVTRIPFRA